MKLRLPKVEIWIAPSWGEDRTKSDEGLEDDEVAIAVDEVAEASGLLDNFLGDRHQRFVGCHRWRKGRVALEEPEHMVLDLLPMQHRNTGRGR